MMASRSARAALGVVWILVIGALIALGTWQVHRRSWKLDLIERVDDRLHAAPVPAPIHQIVGKQDEYRRVFAVGQFIAGKDALVQASTVLGPGWWVMTPFDTDRGVVLVNRGYIPTRQLPALPSGRVTITGLLRLPEPGGGFLRSNDPAVGRWYSRDVAAMARRNHLPTQPYFIDVDAANSAPGQPVGGLTVVSFTNNHLAYAVTWYTLAIMTGAGFLYWLSPLWRRQAT